MAETVLITGASSGIGLELAKLFAADKSDVILVARRREKLDQLAAELRARHGVQARVMVTDLADGAAPQAIYDALTADGTQVDVLVNNAGFGAVGLFTELPLERHLNMIAVNVAAITHLARLFVPPMIQRGHGGVLTVASTAAFQAGPYQAVYFATKAFDLLLSEALSEELAGTGVKVSCLAPGPTATGFGAVARAETTRLFDRALMDAGAVARVAYRGFRTGKPLVVPGWGNKLGILLGRLFPRSWPRKIVKAVQKPR